MFHVWIVDGIDSISRIQPIPTQHVSNRHGYVRFLDSNIEGKHTIEVNVNPNVMYKTQHDLFYVQRPLVSTMGSCMICWVLFVQQRTFHVVFFFYFWRFFFIVARAFGDDYQMTGDIHDTSVGID